MKARRGHGSGFEPGRSVPAQAPLELYGLAEVLGASRTNKDRLCKQLPPPDFVLCIGPVWMGDTVRPWLLKATKAN